MGIGERLESLLDDWDLTQKQLAHDLHIEASTLNGYIKGKRCPDYDTLIRMAEYFDVSTDYLLGVTNTRKRPDEPVNVRESELVGIYRDMMPENQDLLYEQAHFFHKRDMKQKGKKRESKT